MKLKIKKLDPEAIIPKYQTEGSAGFDLHALIKNDNVSSCLNSNCCCSNKREIVIPARSGKVIGTGLSVEVPQGFEMQIRPRSGLAAKFHITVTNSPGTLDCDYRGEIKVILFNLSNDDFVINNEDRIAQAVINKIEQVEFIEVETLSETDRSTGGFGSTGK